MCMCTAMKNISEVECIFTVPFMKTSKTKNVLTTFLLLEKFYPKFIKSETNCVTLYSGCVRPTKTQAFCIITRTNVAEASCNI